MNGPSTSNDADAQRRARRAEQQRKRRQAQRASADPGVTAKLQAQAAQKREYMRYRRTSETFYEQQTARRAAETEEQRAERRRSDAEAARKRRAEETEEQRQRRLDADRNAKRAKRMMQVEKQLRDHEARMFIRDFRRNPFGYCHKRDLSAVSKAVSPTLDAEFPRAGRSKPSAVAIKETSLCIPIAPAENGGEWTEEKAWTWWRKRDELPRPAGPGNDAVTWTQKLKHAKRPGSGKDAGKQTPKRGRSRPLRPGNVVGGWTPKREPTPGHAKRRGNVSGAGSWL